MASLIQAVDDRLAAILEGTATGTRLLPAGRFRRSADRMPLLDPAYPGQWTDRTYELAYQALADHEPGRPANPFDPAWLLDLTVNVHVGYAQGAGAAGGFNPSAAGGGESAAFAVLNARARALNDAQRIWRALNANWRDVTSDPILVDCRRTGAAVINDLGNGRLICTSTVTVWLQLDPANDYDPAL